MAKLAEKTIDQRISKLDGWKREGDFITKSFTFDTFLDGIRFVDRLAKLAESLEHHPDIHIRWTTVRLELQSHDEGGVTARDIGLATSIENELVKRKGRGTAKSRSKA